MRHDEAAALALALNAGVRDDGTPTGAVALTRALVGMTERAFYDASATGASLPDATATVKAVWLRTLGLA